MIRSLRGAHRLIFLALALVLPVVLAAGLAARRPLALVTAAESLPAGAAPVIEWVTLIGTARLRLVSPVCDSSRIWFEFETVGPLRAPDLQLYWTARSLPIARVDSADWLLGSVAGSPRRVFELPPVARPGQGSLLLYSVAHAQLAGAMALSAIAVTR